MDITQCGACGTRVIPRADHSCPSCGRPVEPPPIRAEAGSVVPPPPRADNPYHPLTIQALSPDEIMAHIAKRQRGIRTSLWWMVGSVAAVIAIILAFGYQHLGGLFGLSFISGLVGYMVDSRALAGLRRQQAEATQAAPVI